MKLAVGYIVSVSGRFLASVQMPACSYENLFTALRGRSQQEGSF
jgi:hypothetical protein